MFIALGFIKRIVYDWIGKTLYKDIFLLIIKKINFCHKQTIHILFTMLDKCL